MPKKNKKLIYWDSGIFIGIIKGEISLKYTEIMDKHLQDGSIIIISSVLCNMEVYKTGLNKLQLVNIDGFFKDKKYFIHAPIDKNISKRVAVLRYNAEKHHNKKLKTPDATHLQTAIEYNVYELHTLDDDLLRLEAKKLRVRLPKIVKPEESSLVKGYLL